MSGGTLASASHWVCSFDARGGWHLQLGGCYKRTEGSNASGDLMERADITYGSSALPALDTWCRHRNLIPAVALRCGAACNWTQQLQQQQPLPAAAASSREHGALAQDALLTRRGASYHKYEGISLKERMLMEMMECSTVSHQRQRLATTFWLHSSTGRHMASDPHLNGQWGRCHLLRLGLTCQPPRVAAPGGISSDFHLTHAACCCTALVSGY